MENNRAVELVNGTQFGVLNSKTKEWEHFEYRDGKFLELEEYIIKEGNLEYINYIRTDNVFDVEYINSLTK